MYAAVDVGTNTVRLLIGSVHEGRIEPWHYFRRITRLGGGFSPERGLLPAAMERTLAALQEAAALLQGAPVQCVRGVGTAVLRAAGNGPDFATQAADLTGIPLEIIDGAEEARLSSLGVLSALAPQPTTCLIIDIGGGSTEFILWYQGRALFSRSYPLGVVRLAEDLPSPSLQTPEIDRTLTLFQAELASAGLASLASDPECLLVGTAGTVTTLGALHLGISEYDWQRINNLVLTIPDLRTLESVLEPLSVADRETLAGMEKGRGDLIVPGLRIVLGIMTRFHRKSLIISDFGLLEGILLNLEQTAEG